MTPLFFSLALSQKATNSLQNFYPVDRDSACKDICWSRPPWCWHVPSSKAFLSVTLHTASIVKTRPFEKSMSFHVFMEVVVFNSQIDFIYWNIPNHCCPVPEAIKMTLNVIARWPRHLMAKSRILSSMWELNQIWHGKIVWGMCQFAREHVFVYLAEVSDMWILIFPTYVVLSCNMIWQSAGSKHDRVPGFNNIVFFSIGSLDRFGRKIYRSSCWTWSNDDIWNMLGFKNHSRYFSGECNESSFFCKDVTRGCCQLPCFATLSSIWWPQKTAVFV